MKPLKALIKRNVKLFFKDKAMFFTSLITPAVLLVLYVTFLANVYRDSLTSALPEEFINLLPSGVIGGFVGGQLVSSLLAVSCVTVTFCSNFLMVQDKVNGAVKDLTVSPVKPQILSLAYYLANLFTSLIVCYAACAACLIYLAAVGWCLSAQDVFLLILDVFLVVLFGNALSSIINAFLSTQGQISAVGTIISSGYGFICGAYMPLSSFSEGLRSVISFLPGTYGTSLMRNHALRGAIDKMQAQGLPAEVITALRDSSDCNVYFFGTRVSPAGMYLVLCGSIIILISAFVLINVLRAKKSGRKA